MPTAQSHALRVRSSPLVKGLEGLALDSAMVERSELIVHYAELGHTIDEITLYLNNAHSISTSQANSFYSIRVGRVSM